ncbi:unnamed protein product [Ilex paraguariensis]|uniref:Uncharacterized protein n=1 Tax=Ilex paraguariensis TaxID=185542 RepID=A0ABC8US86_9AQUA
MIAAADAEVNVVLNDNQSAQLGSNERAQQQGRIGVQLRDNDKESGGMGWVDGIVANLEVPSPTIVNLESEQLKEHTENDVEMVLECGEVSPIVNDSGIALSKEKEQRLERVVSKEKVNEGEVPICNTSKHFSPSADSSFWVNNAYSAHGKSTFSLDDENGLVKDKEPPDKGFFSDQENPMGFEENLEDLEIANSTDFSPRQLPKGFASSVGFSAFVFNSLAEKNLWLLWSERVEVKVVMEFEQSLAVTVSHLGSPPVLVTVVYACCDHVLRRPL